MACLSDRLRKRVADVLGLDDPRFEPDYDPFSEEAQTRGDELVAEAEALFREKTVDEWLEVWDGAGVPAGPVRFVQEMLDDEQVSANGLAVDLEHSLAGRVRMVGPMIQMSKSAAGSAKRVAGAGRAYRRGASGIGLFRFADRGFEGERGDAVRQNIRR